MQDKESDRDKLDSIGRREARAVAQRAAPPTLHPVRVDLHQRHDVTASKRQLVLRLRVVVVHGAHERHRRASGGEWGSYFDNEPL